MSPPPSGTSRIAAVQRFTGLRPTMPHAFGGSKVHWPLGVITVVRAWMATSGLWIGLDGGAGVELGGSCRGMSAGLKGRLVHDSLMSPMGGSTAPDLNGHLLSLKLTVSPPPRPSV